MAVGERSLGGTTSLPGMMGMLIFQSLRPASLVVDYRDEAANIMSPKHDAEKVSKWDRTKGAFQGMKASFQGWGKQRARAPDSPRRVKDHASQSSGTSLQVPARAKSREKYS